MDLNIVGSGRFTIEMSKGRNLDDVWIVIKYFISFTKLRLLRKEMSKRGSKRTVICISSSSDDDEEESVEYDDEDDGVGDSEEEFHDEDDGDVNSEEDDDEGESGEEFDDEESDNGCDEGVLSKRVIRFLKGNFRSFLLFPLVTHSPLC